MSKLTTHTPITHTTLEDTVYLYTGAMRCALIAATACSLGIPVGHYEVDAKKGWRSSLYLSLREAVDAGLIQDETVALGYAMILHACGQSAYIHCCIVLNQLSVDACPDRAFLDTPAGLWRLHRVVEEGYANLFAKVKEVEDRHNDGIRAVAAVLVARGSIKEAEAEEILRTNAALHPESDLAASDDCPAAAPTARTN